TVISAKGSVASALSGASMWLVSAVRVRSIEMAAMYRPWQIARMRALRRPARSGSRGGMELGGRVDRPHSNGGCYVTNDIFPLKIAMAIDVAFLMIPGFQLLDMAGPLSVFQTAGEAAAGRRGPAYAAHLVSARGGRVASSSGVEVVTRAWRGMRPDIVVVP